MRHRDGALVHLSQSVHLLHVLPIAATEDAGPCLQHLDVIKPQLTSLDIKTYRVENKLVGLSDCLAVLAILISGEIESTSDEVDVSGVDANVLC